MVASLNQDIRILLLVSQLHLENVADAPADAQNYNGYQVKIDHAVGEVSPRDRMYHTDLGTDKDFPMLSAHEAQIVRENFPEALTEGLE
jgi:isoleucyl-tRNA synthetase